MALLLKIWSNPLVRKIAVYGLIAVGVVLVFRWYGTRQWYKGEARGRLYMADQIEKQKQEEWAAKETEIAKQAVAVQDERIAVEEERQRVNRDRANLSRTLRDSLQELQIERSRAYADAANVPDDRVWADIRAISRQLATETR